MATFRPKLYLNESASARTEPAPTPLNKAKSNPIMFAERARKIGMKYGNAASKQQPDGKSRQGESEDFGIYSVAEVEWGADLSISCDPYCERNKDKHDEENDFDDQPDPVISGARGT
jgi:hypothetical protein